MHFWANARAAERYQERVRKTTSNRFAFQSDALEIAHVHTQAAFCIEHSATETARSVGKHNRAPRSGNLPSKCCATAWQKLHTSFLVLRKMILNGSRILSELTNDCIAHQIKENEVLKITQNKLTAESSSSCPDWSLKAFDIFLLSKYSAC
jgi:hypothetical protein